MEKLIYKDKAGNKIYKMWVVKENIMQYIVKNREDEIVNAEDSYDILTSLGIVPEKPKAVKTELRDGYTYTTYEAYQPENLIKYLG